MSIQVAKDGFSDGFAAVTRIAQNNGGFVLSSQIRGQRRGTLTLRIPAKRFDDAMVALRGIGVVQAQSITGKDVTAQFIDLQARLENAIGQRTVLRDLMAEATTIQETITVQNRLSQVELQVEQIQGQLNFIEDQVAEATVRVEIHEKDARAAPADGRGGEPEPGQRMGPGDPGVPERRVRRGDRARLPAPARRPRARRLAGHGWRCGGVAQPAERPVALGGDRRDRGVVIAAALRRAEPRVGLHPRAIEVVFVPEPPFGRGSRTPIRTA